MKRHSFSHLEDILGRRLDLGRLDSRNLIYAVEAFKTGRLLYAADEPDAMAFASRLQSLYLELKLDLLHEVASEHWEDLEALCLALGLKIVVAQ